MKIRLAMISMVSVFLLVLAGCGGANGAGDQTPAEASEEKGTIVFGMSEWTSTEAPTAIMKLILEEAGYNVQYTKAEQPVLFLGMKNKEIDFFMDAWLPYTEAVLWSEYENDLVKVATSYEQAPLGWVVPTYVEENSIPELIGNAEKFEGQIVGLSAGSGMTETSKQMIEDYGLDGFKYVETGEAAMMAEAKRKIMSEKPILFLGWRPHSMFSQYDLKFLEDPEGYFQYDNVYVISYKGIEEAHPEAYDIVSKWSIDVADLEEMMYKYETDGTSFEDLAKEWVANHRDKVDAMLGK